MKLREMCAGLLLMVVIVSVSAAAATGSGPPATVEDARAAGFGRFVVRVEFSDEAILGSITRWVEPWEIDPEQGFLIVDVGDDGYQKLLDLGLTVALLPKLTERVNTPLARMPGQELGIPSYPCYRTVEETLATGEALAATYPTLARWIDIGDSWDKTEPGGSLGYDLMVLALTNQAVGGDKPVLWLEGAIHARELTTAETVTRFAEHLLANYDVNPDVTWVLDHHEIHLLLVTNPDGRKHAEDGLWWRKNTNEDYCSSSPDERGADLNRNFEFEWGCCGGSSSFECDETFRGPIPASEPETQAIQDYVASVIPDRRPDDLGIPAPEDTAGIFIDVHSYGGDVLSVFGFQDPPAPNDTQILTLGRKFAFFTGYEAHLGSYGIVDGSTKDWAYGTLGVPAFTFELGTEFFQECAPFEETIYPDNLQTLLYAAKAVRRPYTLAAGPDALSVTSWPSVVAPGGLVSVAAVIDDTRYEAGSGEPTQSIVAAELYVDVPPWADGATAIPMAAADGTFDAVVEGVDAVVDTSEIATGRHLVFVRGQDMAGNWGVVSAAFLWVLDPAEAARFFGEVTNSDDGSPLAADIEAGPFSTASDPIDGSYDLMVFPGTYDVTARADGFAPTTVTDIVAPAGSATTVDLVLVPYREVLFDDVEGGNAGWTAEPPWAITSEASNSPTHSWTDSPGEDYGDDVDTSLSSASLDLGGMTGVLLEFSHRYEIESGWDHGYLEISEDNGSNWTTVAGYTGFQPYWETVTISLPQLDGVAEARIRFRLETDGSWTEDGWHVDDIILRGAGTAPAPDVFHDGFESGDTTPWSLTFP